MAVLFGKFQFEEDGEHFLDGLAVICDVGVADPYGCSFVDEFVAQPVVVLDFGQGLGGELDVFCDFVDYVGSVLEELRDLRVVVGCSGEFGRCG